MHVINLTRCGLKAMEELEKLEDDRRAGKAPGPVRKKGIASPAAIVGPAILATAISTVVAVIFCKVMDQKHHYRYKGKFSGEKLNAWTCNIGQDFIKSYENFQIFFTKSAYNSNRKAEKT